VGAVLSNVVPLQIVADAEQQMVAREVVSGMMV